MAIKQCVECGKDVSTDAGPCPHCGKKDPTGEQTKQVQRGCAGCLVIFGVIFLIAMLLADGSPDPDSGAATYVDLSARINFDGTQFTIANLDTFPWLDVELEVNGGLVAGGYKLEHPRMDGGSTYSVGAAQFAKSSGERFNPFTMKPQRFCISAKTPEGADGIYCGDW